MKWPEVILTQLLQFFLWEHNFAQWHRLNVFFYSLGAIELKIRSFSIEIVFKSLRANGRLAKYFDLNEPCPELSTQHSPQVRRSYAQTYLTFTPEMFFGSLVQLQHCIFLIGPTKLLPTNRIPPKTEKPRCPFCNCND